MRSFVVYALFATLISVTMTLQVSAGEEPGPLSSYKPELPRGFGEKLAAVDLAKAEQSFMRRCSSCHDHEKQGGHGKGPHLWNLLGRKAGSIPGFEFSEAMKNSGHIWNDATLNYYLTNTKRAVPDLAMNFRGLRREKDRVRMIAFLRKLHDNPPALP